jgi:hypothetical protein
MQKTFMKKTLIVVVVLIAVAIASFLWVRSQVGIADPARLVPGDAVAAVIFPDLPRSAIRWPQTAMARIGGEEEVSAFLEKPLGQVAGERGADEAGKLLAGLKPGRVFAALTSLGEDTAAIVIGFQYWGSKADFDRAVAGFRRAVYRGGEPETEISMVEGIEVRSTALEGSGHLVSASAGRWGFLANDSGALEETIRRVKGADAVSLAEDPIFQSVVSRLPGDPDMLAFARVGPFLDTLLAVGDKMGAQADDTQVGQLRKAQALGFGMKLDGTNMRDALFVLRPEPPDAGTLSHAGMAFTSEETLGYFDALIGLESLSQLASNPALGKMLPPKAKGIAPLLQSLPDALTNEASLSFSWPSGTMRPDILVAAGVRDAALAEQILMQAASVLPETTVSETGGMRVFSFPSLRSPLADPAVAVGETDVLIALDPGEIAGALARRDTGTPLQSAPSFDPALAAFKSANESFGYIDARGVFERVYPMVRQMVVFGAALVPGAADVIDASKLPETDSIAKHLTPIVFSQTRLADGYLMESTGPITMHQLLFLGGGAGTAFLPKQP